MRVESVTERAERPLYTGQELGVAAEVRLGALAPEDVSVEVYYGRVRGDHAIGDGASRALVHVADLGSGRHRFEGSVPAGEAGEHAYAVRVVPRSEALPNRFATRLVAWQ